MASVQALRDQLAAKKVQSDDTSKKISDLNLKIYRLSQEFKCEAAKIQHRITKVQLSRPRGNPANQWPHCPMSHRFNAFFQSKDRRERALWKKEDQLKQSFDHEKAILTSQN